MITAIPPPLLTTGQVAKRLSVHRDTVYLWITRGVQSRTGGVAQLAAQRVGGRWKVSEQALADFLAACQGQAKARVPTESAWERQCRKAQRELEEFVRSRRKRKR